MGSRGRRGPSSWSAVTSTEVVAVAEVEVSLFVATADGASLDVGPDTVAVVIGSSMC